MPLANFNNSIFNLPFNMNTFYQIWGLSNPDEIKNKIISKQRTNRPTKNLEEQAIKLVGNDVYEALIKGYTEKQWGRKATDLPPFIIKRLPVRFTFDNNYFNDKYQGIPEGGYTKMVEKILEGIEVKLNVNFLDDREHWQKISKKIIYTGPIDEYYNFRYGKLEYRSLRFETETIDQENYQGCEVVNYDHKTPFTRIIEHKHFGWHSGKTIITENILKNGMKVKKDIIQLMIQKIKALSEV